MVHADAAAIVVMDDPLSRAENSIYSTNAFAVSHSAVEAILSGATGVCSKNESIAIDLSALITLHQLDCSIGQQTTSGDTVPIGLPAQLLEEGSRLVLHQGSLRHSAKRREALDRKDYSTG